MQLERLSKPSRRSVPLAPVGEFDPFEEESAGGFDVLAARRTGGHGRVRDLALERCLDLGMDGRRRRVGREQDLQRDPDQNTKRRRPRAASSPARRSLVDASHQNPGLRSSSSSFGAVLDGVVIDAPGVWVGLLVERLVERLVAEVGLVLAIVVVVDRGPRSVPEVASSTDAAVTPDAMSTR